MMKLNNVKISQIINFKFSEFQKIAKYEILIIIYDLSMNNICIARCAKELN